MISLLNRTLPRNITVKWKWLIWNCTKALQLFKSTSLLINFSFQSFNYQFSIIIGEIKNIKYKVSNQPSGSFWFFDGCMFDYNILKRIHQYFMHVNVRQSLLKSVRKLSKPSVKDIKTNKHCLTRQFSWEKHFVFQIRPIT